MVSTHELTVPTGQAVRNPVSYINERLSGHIECQEGLDAAQSLLKEINSLCQTTSLRLNGIVDGMLRLAPRLNYDVDAVSQNQGALQTSTHTLAADTQSGLSHIGDDSVHALERFHLVQERLRGTEDVIAQVHSSQGYLNFNSFREHLKLRNFEEALSYLQHLARLNSILRDTALYKQRAEELRSLQDEYDNCLRTTTSTEAPISSADDTSARPDPSSAIEETYYSFMKRFGPSIREPSPSMPK
ncbi:hypothetical protein BCR37DRAFT_390289 [Protomyces lactucae-debilis]|uniref:Uncharacterized protein n=1 Tax=Protomyces lactucae-debilis TaxID=2754530 RepID=A0A1Y2FX60_PROLT|nr:uncharacterized protein BCR37DRAFT_390289 [Protomyces lactucae-debilis]ORY87766.1 hypothetical protein BCR37DRAFT_390289 [Protomyces lactucae-debilis]